MALEDVSLPKKYKNQKTLFEQNLDNWRQATEEAFAKVNLNLTQLRKDCFLSNYDFLNNGNNAITPSLQEQINLLASGGTPISGTTSDTWTINTDGFSATLSSTGLTDFRTYTYPDESGKLVVAAQIPPLGSIIEHYDFGGLIPIDTSHWAYCNGQSVTIDGYGAETTPDTSGRYLVGFGTDGGGDIDSAVWSTSAVGNSGHTINIAHTHTVASHNHTMAHTHSTPAHAHTLSAHVHTGPSHSHSTPAHSHSGSGLYALIALNDATGSDSDGLFMQTMSVSAWDSDKGDDVGGAEGTPGTSYNNGVVVAGSTATDGSGTTGNGGTGNTGAPSVDSTDTSGGGTTGASSAANTGSASPLTDSQLSSIQSIQPRSVRVRHIMRIK